MFGRKPFEGLGISKSDKDTINNLIEKELDNVTTHWGDTKFNPSTWAYVYAKVEEKLTGKAAVREDFSQNRHKFLIDLGLQKP